MSLGDEKVFPCEVGLTKREFVAALALQALLANPTVTTSSDYKIDLVVEAAITTAEILLSNLNRSKDL